jgi:cobalt-precorrin 5A hydrolase/precorrin-3B C17-methyltransferase
MVGRAVLIALTPAARALAERLGGPLEADVAPASGTVRDQVVEAFTSGRPVVGICAAGILIRILAPFLADKRDEPPVIAVAEDGSAAVPLLGGHHGANDLARSIAALTGGIAAVTTASDLAFGTALDAPPEGYVLANAADMKAFAMALLQGDGVEVEDDVEWLKTMPRGGKLRISVTPYARQGGPRHLVYHAKTLALGVGCERGAPAPELIALADASLAANKLAPRAVAGVFSLDLKADEPAVHALAAHLGVPARFFSAETLNAEEARLANPSEAVRREVGVAGVAEGSALAAAGPDGALLVAKVKAARATLAIAVTPHPLITLPGRPRGRLAVVGIGPGSDEWMTPAAVTALRHAGDWVGYGLYLDLVAAYRSGQAEHRFALGEEEKRVRHAIDLAAEGRTVALVCSGDAGIYAMASLVYEALAAPAIPPRAARIAVEVIPGISAFQAAAARTGALTGHDFCAISLSDLLTPWAVIETRLKAAAEGDFVVAFYNPRSRRRSDHLARAMAILAPHRRPDTPVVIASHLGHPAERLEIVDLATFVPDSVDMATIVLVGSSQSRRFSRGDGKTHAFTPRGYAAKPGSRL